jgi:aminoglycoside phosphotransferase (APT) family kinase protein
VGDPACDLQVAWTFLSAEARAVLRTSLKVDDATWARGRGWGLATTLPRSAVFADPVDAARTRQLIDEFIADYQRDR